MYYLCSENKGADQLRGYREADPRLCFRICKKNVFFMTRLKYCFGPNEHTAMTIQTVIDEHISQCQHAYANMQQFLKAVKMIIFKWKILIF